MASIKINESLWEAVSDTEKAQILAHLKKHRLLSDGDSIIGNASTPVATNEGFFDDLKRPLCLLACDTAATAAAAALTLTGPALVAALAAIAVVHDACRNGC